MRIVRTRSIPHVDDARLLVDLRRLHDKFHTQAGLRGFDGPRRNLIDNGLKIRAIRIELAKRGVAVDFECRICHRPPG